MIAMYETVLYTIRLCLASKTVKVSIIKIPFLTLVHGIYARIINEALSAPPSVC